MGKVAKLPRAANAEAEEKLPPFDISVSANFADLQQIMLRMPVTEPITRAEANRRLDAIVALASRQRSRAEIVVLTASLADKKRALALQEGRRKDEAEKHEKALAEIEDSIAKLMERHEGMLQEGAAEWTAQNRQGDYKPQGHRKNTLTALQRDIDAAKDRVKTAQAEYEQKVAHAQDQILERLTEEIAAIEREIDKHRAIVEDAE